jgi:uncharacterized membrane protein
VKLKMPKGSNIDKWLEKLEVPARLFVWIFVMILAVLTVVPNISNLTETTGRMLLTYLILFFIALTIVSSIEIRHARRKQAKPSYEDVRESTYIEHSSYNKWISIGLLVLVAIILVAVFVPRLLQLDAQGYQLFYTAFAGIGAWVTGIALAVFAYQQYKLRQTEHRLLFKPQLLMSSSAPIKNWNAVYNERIYNYSIEWSVFIQDTSSVPIIIEHMAIKLKSARGKLGREEYIPYDCYLILEPDGLEPPFQVTMAIPQRIKYVIAGHDMAQLLDYVAGNSKSRVIQLIFKVRAKTPQGPSMPIMEISSDPFFIPENADWSDSTPLNKPIF